jgi:hypothetical protein
MPIRSLGLLALVFVLLFALQLAAVLFPLQLLDPAWQWQISNALINAAPIPLLALTLLLIACHLDPSDPLLRQRQRLFRQLAVAASLGFLLLLPLQLSAGLRQQNAVGSAQMQRFVGAEKRLAQLRQLMARARSNTELNTSLLKLSGPVLSPADLNQPLPLLKAQVNAVFDQAQIQINRDRSALPPATAATALPELLRNAVSCLLLATAYAAFARRHGSEVSLLEEGQLSLQRLRRFGPFRRAAPAPVSEAAYIRQLSGNEE